MNYKYLWEASKIRKNIKKKIISRRTWGLIMAEVIDKELLAICKLSNLKLEFADLKTKDADTNNEIYHTIFSILEKEHNAIINNNPEKILELFLE
jgi:hypothetical protein